MRLSRLFIALIFFFIVQLTVAQAPQGFTFQAIARDNSANPIVSTALTIETGILSDTISNIYLWKETHPVTTNQFGLFSLIIGKGTRTGGSASTFADIDWAAGPRFIRTKVLYQSTWRDMGAARLWSVPYAMVADKSSSLLGNPIQVNGGTVYILNNMGVGNSTPGGVKLSVMGDDVASTEALFEVKRKDGQTMFAVYNDAVNVYVPVTPGKASKGGFAIGGFDEAKGTVHDYFIVSPDSIRLYFDDSPVVKGSKGGFAIGGFDEAKATPGKEYLRVTDDSTRVYINNQAKGAKGGFAIGGFDAAKGTAAQSFMVLEPENYLIGHLAGNALTTGKYNSFFGYESGSKTTSGANNAFMGYYAGRPIQSVTVTSSLAI